MNGLLLDRLLGLSKNPWKLRQDVQIERIQRLSVVEDIGFPAPAHRGATNSLAIERDENRYLLSGGADATLKIWDLQSFEPQESEYEDKKFLCISTIPRNTAHSFAVSCCRWWPNDNGLFVSASFDNSLKIWDANTLECALGVDLGVKIYHFGISPTGQHATIAAAADQPIVRLVDIRTGSAAHSLAGHSGPKVLAAEWSPREPHVLATGGSDATVRLWDIRRADACVCVLDAGRAAGGVSGVSGVSGTRVKSHSGPVNGLAWTADGTRVVSCGNDDRIRVWDLIPAGGALRVVNFGPLVRNKHLQHVDFALVEEPSRGSANPLLVYPSDTGDIVWFELHDGRTVARLSRGPGAPRSCAVEVRDGEAGKFFSGGLDGRILNWEPESAESSDEDEDEEEEGEIGAKEGLEDVDVDVLNRVSREMAGREARVG